jgi:DNA-binding SARP family transcriptional activator
LEFRILGPLEVLDGDRAVALPRGRARALLARLILDAGNVVSTDRLISDLWGEVAPPTVRTALQGLVSNLRKRLDGKQVRDQPTAVLRTAPSGYALAVDPTCVDASRFRRLLEQARTADPMQRAATLHQALGLWRGPPLADFIYEPFAQREIASLEELRLSAIEERIDADLVLALASELVAELERLVAEHPFRERLRGQLMLALYRTGRQAEALEAYRDARETLVNELGIEPGPQLRRLEESILRQEPALELGPPGTWDARERLATISADSAQPWLQGERRVVTVAFVDLASFFDHDRVDAEVLRRRMARSRDAANQALRRHGATVEELVGDVVVGIFGAPVAHEDDALRAVRAAFELQEAGTRSDAESERTPPLRLSIRVGVETGEVVVGVPGSRRATVSGDAVNMAARLQRVAGDGEVLVGEAAREVLRGAAQLERVERADGRRGPLTAWKLVDVVAGASALDRHLDAPIVGRGAELSRLHTAFEGAVEHGRAHCLTVVGDAGIGKSRVAREFTETLGSGAQILRGHCLAYGEGITFSPLREIVLSAAGAGGSHALSKLLAGEPDGKWIAEQVAAAIGLTQEPARGEYLFPAVRRLFEALSQRQPLVLALEDVHWAESTLLDLIEYLSGALYAPVFLLCLARPELIEDRPGWGAGSRNVENLFLDPLGAAEIEHIAEGRAGGTLPEETRTRVVEAAQGNPLFAEQLVAALQDEGEVSIPASVHALLAARLDRLGPAERDLLRSAAVVGADFTVDALEALVPEQARPFVGRHLEALERKQLIRPGRTGRRDFSFRHVLIHLAAYRNTTREDRARLHERFAEWLRTEAPERPVAFDEMLGYHLEQALSERRALGRRGEHEAALAARAGEHLAAAGLRAASRYDVAAAANLLSRAHAMLPSTNPQRRTVMRRLAEVYQVVGRLSESDSVLATLLAQAETEGDESLAQVARLERARLSLFRGPDPRSLRSIREEAERGLEVFGESADVAGLALASYVLAYAHFRVGEMDEMERVARSALIHADRSARRREAMAARMLVAWAVVGGSTPVREAIRVCERLVDVAGREHPMVLSDLAILRAMLGDIDSARVLIDRARTLALERMRGRSPMLIMASAGASVELAADDLGAAERELRVALDLARDVGLRENIAQTAARLSLLAVERDPEQAELLASLSRENAPAESVAAQALWRAAAARVMASRNATAGAERVAREAVGLVPAQMLNLRADLLAVLAEVLRTGEDRNAAMPPIAEAIALYEHKGNLVSAARARSLAG